MICLPTSGPVELRAGGKVYYLELRGRDAVVADINGPGWQARKNAPDMPVDWLLLLLRAHHRHLTRQQVTALLAGHEAACSAAVERVSEAFVAAVAKYNLDRKEMSSAQPMGR